MIALGLYRLGHGDSYVGIGPLSFKGIPCYRIKNLENLELSGIMIIATSVHTTELPARIVFHVTLTSEYFCC